MAKIKLFIVNVRMLQMLDDCKREKLCSTQEEWCKKVGVVSANITQVRRGYSSFTHKHVLAACLEYNRSPTWVYGLTEERYLKLEHADPFQVIISELTRLKAKHELALKKLATLAKKADKK